jgi:hypothetical protein
VVGPTEALRGRAGGPGVPAPHGAAPGLPGQGRASGWQLALRVWESSGVDWQDAPFGTSADADADPYAANQYTNDWFAPTSPPADQYEADHYEAEPPAEDDYEDDHQADDLQPAGQYLAEDIRPAEQYLADDRRPVSRPRFDPHRTSPDLAINPRVVNRYPGSDLSVAAAELTAERHSAEPYLADPVGQYADERDLVDPYPTYHELAVIPTPAGYDEESGARGSAVREPADPPLPRRIRRAGGPPPARPFEDAPAPAYDAPPARPEPEVQPQPSFRSFATPRSFGPSPSLSRPSMSQPSMSRPSMSRPSMSRPSVSQPSFTQPLSAPVAPAPPLMNAAADLSDSDELFRAWQGSVRQATAPRPPWPARRPAPPVARRRGWPVARVGVPAAVIVIVGAGALLMLTGRANQMLASTGASGPSGSGASAQPTATAASLNLAGYPGEQGTVGVTALWTVAGTTVAVGYADNHPAVWRRGGDGSWSLVSAAVLGSQPGHLTSVSEGPDGWIAVGSAQEDGLVEPVVYASTDGVTWSPLMGLSDVAGAAAQFLGVTASSGGYLVVGQVGTGSTAYAGFWWSSDLQNWTSGGNSANHGSAAIAAAATPDGFVAVGSENGCHTIWTSADGKTWQGHDLAKPAGATTASLRYVAVGSSGTVVGAGFATTSSGNIPLVVTTTDNGAHVTQTVLDSPGSGTVTGLTATADGYVAVGTTGAGATTRAVTWTSPDGLSWSSATTVASAGADQITALTASGTATAQHGGTSTILSIPTP